MREQWNNDRGTERMIRIFPWSYSKTLSKINLKNTFLKLQCIEVNARQKRQLHAIFKRQAQANALDERSVYISYLKRRV
jgi:hypothetical protein